MRILVVEDDGATRRAMLLVLTGLGHEVATAADGAQALAALDDVPPFDVVLLDLMMPVLDGWEFLDRLRQRPEPRPRVVVLTAAAELSWMEAVEAVLTKPVDVDELVAVLGGGGG